MDSDSTPSPLQERVLARDEHIRESWVLAMEARIVRDQLAECRRKEDVNAAELCKDWADRYMRMLRDNRVKGYKNVDT